MVILNKVVPIDYNKMKKIILKKSNESIMKTLDELFFNNENKDEYIKYILKNNNESLKEIFNSDNNIYLFINNNYCVHKYKRGNREGQICGAKIEINSDNYLCSRHNRSYKPKQRNYNINKRCSHVRNNNELCKHICRDNNKYCYIHKKIYEKDIKEDNIDYIKRKNIEELKNRRKLYFKMKKAKYLKNSKISDFSKISKIKNIIIEYITNNNIDINIFMKNKNKYKFLNNIINKSCNIT